MKWLSKLNTGNMTLELVLAGLFVGVSIAILVSLYNKKVPGKLVRRLLRRSACSPDTALSLRELEYKGSCRMIAFSLRRGGTLRRIVRVVGDDEEAPAPDTTEKTDGDATEKKTAAKAAKKPSGRAARGADKLNILEAKLYIPKDKKVKAEALYPSRRGSLVGAVIAIAAFGAALIGVYYAVPELLQLIENFVNIISGT